MKTPEQFARKYVKLARVHRAEDEGHAVVLKIGNQSFELNCPSDLVTARWRRRQLGFALYKLVAFETEKPKKKRKTEPRA